MNAQDYLKNLNNISDIVPKILRDKVTINTNKKIFTEDTKGIKKIVVPNKNPYSIIQDLTTDNN